jgi:methyl coenzyme M reductase beta subunit
VDTEEQLNECVTTDSLENLVITIMAEHLEALDEKTQLFTTEKVSKLELKVFDEFKQFKDQLIYD